LSKPFDKLRVNGGVGFGGLPASQEAGRSSKTAGAAPRGLLNRQRRWRSRWEGFGSWLVGRWTWCVV